jgi:uncharacterized protein (TIGR03435 family)
MTRMLAATLLAAAAALDVSAQAPRQSGPPQFDAVSIKQNRSADTAGGIRVSPGGRFEFRNTTLKGLIGSVFQRYGFDQRPTEGGPNWIDTARFDILVQTGTGTPPNDPDGFPGQLFAMMQALLRERFGLVVHNEMREQPIYRLVRVRPGGPLEKGPLEKGPLWKGLRSVPEGCAAALKTLTGGQRAEWRPGRGPDCTFGGPPGQLQGNAVSMDMIARVLGAQVRRHVVNETGIAGSFDLDLTFSPEFVQGPPGSRAPGDPLPAPSDAPSIFTAVQEQLGLRLETARGPVDVFIVDRASMPTEN